MGVYTISKYLYRDQSRQYQLMRTIEIEKQKAEHFISWFANPKMFGNPEPPDEVAGFYRFEIRDEEGHVRMTHETIHSQVFDELFNV